MALIDAPTLTPLEVAGVRDDLGCHGLLEAWLLPPRLLLPPGGRRKRGGSGEENGERGLAAPHPMLVLGVA